MADVDFLRKALNRGHTLPDEDAYWAAATPRASAPPRNQTFAPPSSPTMPPPDVDPGNRTNPNLPDAPPSTLPSGDVAGFYQQVLNGLMEPDHPGDFGAADFGQKWGYDWFSRNKDQMLSKALPGLVSKYGGGDYGGAISKFQDPNKAAGAWHWLQLLYSAASLMNENADDDIFLYDRIGDVGGDEDAARRHWIEGYLGGAPSQVQWKDRSNPHYWIR